jgi:predicted ATPase
VTFTLSSFRRRLYAGGEQELHGETFLEVLRQRFAEPGFSLIDEPEAALSFTGCLGLIGLLASSRTPAHRR